MAFTSSYTNHLIQQSQYYYGTENYFNVTGSIENTGNILLHGGTLSIKNQGAQSEARFYCEVNNAHYTALKAQPHALFSGNPITLLPAYDLDFAKPNFQANITASGDISASGFYYGDGSQLTGISTTPFPFSVDAVITGSLWSNHIIGYYGAITEWLNLCIFFGI